MPRQRNTGLELRGDLQAEVMEAVWRLGEATVDQVRAEQPKRHRSGYTTLQTVMNRLADRGLLTRERRGKAFVYKPTYEEHEYLARTISGHLADASPEARRAALVSLVGGLEPEELEEVARYATMVRRARRGEAR